MNLPNLAAANPACPHLLIRQALGQDLVAALFEYACARECDFSPGRVRNRFSGPQRLDPAVRDCSHLPDLGTFQAPIKARLEAIKDTAVRRLGLFEIAIEPCEFEISRYADGGHFAPHIDTGTRLEQIRVLSCVYYFAPAPLRFSGGALRLRPLPTLSTNHVEDPQTVDILPETDTLIILPSWLCHEVLKVVAVSGAWGDARFAVNCWFHRTK